MDHGKVAAQAAEVEWNLDILDPPAWRGKEAGQRHSEAWMTKWERHVGAIRMYYRTNGWRDKGNTYLADGDGEWCGMFAGWCHADAGLRMDVRRSFLPSCYRLGELVEGRAVGGVKAPTGWERVELKDRSTVRPGDIYIVGEPMTDGHHITIVVDVPPVTEYGHHAVMTIGGNERGIGPNGGAPRQGVSKAIRRTAKAARILRFPEEWYS